MDNVFAFIERSDTDYDGHYKEEEIRAMIQQVEATIHIDVDEELLADKLKEDKDGSHDIGDVFSAVQDSTHTD